jgi:transposase-like protein
MRYPEVMRGLRDNACTKAECDNCGKRGINIGGHGWFLTKSGRRRRYRCKVCGSTVSTNTSTAYCGLRCTRAEFDQVASMRVEGVSLSATARVTGRSRNTIARWLQRASAAAELFNQRVVRDFEIVELQADELCTFIGGKRRRTWLFATIEVWSRLWASSLVGRRSYRNTKAVIVDVVVRGRLVGDPLITSDGFEYYFAVVRRLFGPACVYGQVIKTRRNNRVIRVERRIRIGTKSRLKDALLESEDSETLNTLFIERLNLTIRQGSAYLRRRSPCHARCKDKLGEHVELLRCHYNFVRRHSGLKFGRKCRTPAMQAGLVTRQLSFRDIFTARGLSIRLVVAVICVARTDHITESTATGAQRGCWTPGHLRLVA